MRVSANRKLLSVLNNSQRVPVLKICKTMVSVLLDLRYRKFLSYYSYKVPQTTWQSGFCVVKAQGTTNGLYLTILIAMSNGMHLIDSLNSYGQLFCRIQYTATASRIMLAIIIRDVGSI